SNLMVHPRVLLLDEPASGVNPTLLNTLHDFILAIQRETRTPFLIVEHNMEFIMSLASRIIVMHQGRVLEEGTPAEIQTNPRVIESYLGWLGPPPWSRCADCRRASTDRGRGHRPAGGRRRDRHHHRPERRRQIDPAEGPLQSGAHARRQHRARRSVG